MKKEQIFFHDIDTFFTSHPQGRYKLPPKVPSLRDLPTLIEKRLDVIIFRPLVKENFSLSVYKIKICLP